jgi:hypothetical protein
VSEWITWGEAERGGGLEKKESIRWWVNRKKYKVKKLIWGWCLDSITQLIVKLLDVRHLDI